MLLEVIDVDRVRLHDRHRPRPVVHIASSYVGTVHLLVRIKESVHNIHIRPDQVEYLLLGLFLIHVVQFAFSLCPK